MQLKNVINALAITCEWTLILGLIFLNVHYSYTPLVLISVFAIGSRFHALGILMHEAAHFNLFTSRRWNDRLAQIFLCSPFFISLSSYRNSHILHHQHSLTDKDPTYTRKQGQAVFQFPKKNGGFFAWELIKIFFGYGIVLNLKDISRNNIRKAKKHSKMIRMTMLVCLLVGSLYYMNWLTWFLLLWILPLFTVLPTLNYWRTICEHSSVTTIQPTRTIIYGSFIKWIISPYNVNYHLEHHLYPKVSWYALPALHFKQPKGVKDGQVTYGFASLWNEFVRC